MEKSKINMSNLQECPICEGVGTVENNKGIEIVCFTCQGKGTISEQPKSQAKKDDKASKETLEQNPITETSV
jgi:DnaJ-class molecular chaperone